MEKNNQLAFDIAEKELGICPIMTGKEMASVGEPDQLSMVMYLTQFYEMFRDSLSSSGEDLGLRWGQGGPNVLIGAPESRPALTPRPDRCLHPGLSCQGCEYITALLSKGFPDSTTFSSLFSQNQPF